MAATPRKEDIIRQAYVTLVTSDAYTIGACVLGHSLRKHKTSRVLVVLVTKSVSPECRSQLDDVFDVIHTVEEMNSKDPVHLALLARPELGVTFTKIHAWTLKQFEKCVFLDADTLTLANIDELFDRPDFSAAPDVGWPDCFNSGVFVFKPSDDTYAALLEHAARTGSFDGGDQGLLNTFYNTWSSGDSAHRLPFVYNMTANASYGYVPAYQQYKDNIKVIHFIGSHKPWNGMPQPGPGMNAAVSLVETWWRYRDDYISYCSLSSSYKTSFGVRPTRSPGPDAEANAPPPLLSSSPKSPHDTKRPLSESYLESRSFSEIEGLLDHHISKFSFPSLSPEDEDEQDPSDPSADPSSGGRPERRNTE